VIIEDTNKIILKCHLVFFFDHFRITIRRKENFMDLDKMYAQLKNEVKNELFSEGTFKVLVDNNTVLQTEALILTHGSILPKDWDVVEDAIYGFDGVPKTRFVFENKEGQFPCLLSDQQDSPLVGIVPGVTLSSDMEALFNEIMPQVNTEEDFERMNLLPSDKDAWNNYMSAKTSSTNTQKPKL
jgi:hypothetical protein